jgi:hypothetical protein
MLREMRLERGIQQSHQRFLPMQCAKFDTALRHDPDDAGAWTLILPISKRGCANKNVFNTCGRKTSSALVLDSKSNASAQSCRKAAPLAMHLGRHA